MSRQYDEAMEGRFDLHGTEYEIIDPKNIEELTQAYEVKTALESYISGLLHDEDSSVYDSLLQEQIDYIKEYIDNIDEFDSSKLANNIAYLGKKYGMRVGELEDMIGVSTGYLSRTIKENSKKKISIDVVWKISKLFGTDVNSLIDTEMWMPQTNTALLVRFLNRLYQDTKDDNFAWENEGYGGCGIEANRYLEMGLVTEDEEGKPRYHPNHLNKALRWVLDGDIYCLECFEKDKDLVIIPYTRDEKGSFSGYDFIFVWKEAGAWKWEKVFYTSDDPFGSLKDGAKTLYNYIVSSELDAKISPGIHDLISNYVNGRRP